jgi:hypothetical protein
MSITRPAGPSGGAAIIGRVVPHLLSRGPGALPPTGGAAAPQTSQPIQLFMLKSSDITDESFVKKAVPVGWRYLIFGQGPIAVADVKEASGSGPLTFGSLIRGPIAERLTQAADLAARDYDAGPGKFEARILEIPSLYISALWLYGPRDIFIPFLEGGARDTMPVRVDTSFASHVVELAAAKRQAPKAESR